MFMAAQQCTVIYVGKRCKLLQSSNCGREKIYILYGGKIQWQKNGSILLKKVI